MRWRPVWSRPICRISPRRTPDASSSLGCKRSSGIAQPDDIGGANHLLERLAIAQIRRRSVLDLWLMVVMCAYLIEVCLISFPVPVRYSIGWYAGQVFGLVSGSLVLFVLLYEITML